MRTRSFHVAKLIGQGYTGYLVRITDDEKSAGPDQQSNAARNDREVREGARKRSALRELRLPEAARPPKSIFI